MCNGTKIEIIPPPPPPPPPKSKSSSKSKPSSSTKPAFPKAQFNKSGYCIKHHDVQLAMPKKDENNQLIFKELKPSCPSCLKGSHINKKSTSLGGGKVRTGRVHGYDPSHRSRSKSREQRSTSTSGEQRTSGRSQSRGRDKSSSRSQSRSQSIGRRSKSRERKSTIVQILVILALLNLFVRSMSTTHRLMLKDDAIIIRMFNLHQGK